ncbi:MAG: DUF2868 domain-containing protein [Caldimonas sp.]
MNEHSAREATLLEAFETAQPASASWADEDRAWADRVALEAAGAEVAPDDFVAQRARHALQRLAPRERFAAQWLAQPLWHARWIGIVALIAFACGLVADSIGSSQRINLLAPPLWGVLVWNAVVYLVLLGTLLAGLLRRGRKTPGPVVRAMESLLRARRRMPKASAGGSATALRRYALLWSTRTSRLSVLRAETVLHAGAAALGLGLVAGLYARGLVLDYRAAWESTFLSAGVAHALVATLLEPASRLSGIALPDAATFASLRSAHGEIGVGAPAAPWIHLFGLTLLLFVVLPRALLALLCGARAAVLARRFALPLDEPYFQRLLRRQRGGAARIVVWPYGRTPSPQATLALQALLAAAFGPKVALQIAPTVAFGAEDDAALAADPATTHALALFDLNATPEAENHGRFIERIVAALPPAAVLAVLVDEAAFAQRFGGLPERLEQRRDAWRAWAESHAAVPVFVDLEAPDPAAAEPMLQAGFTRPAPVVS